MLPSELKNMIITCQQFKNGLKMRWQARSQGGGVGAVGQHLLPGAKTRVLDRHKKADVRMSCLQFFGVRQSLLDVLHSLGLQCYAVISVVTAPPPAA